MLTTSNERAFSAAVLLLFLSPTAGGVEKPFTCLELGKLRYVDEHPHKTKLAKYCFNQKLFYLKDQACMARDNCLASKRVVLSSTAKHAYSQIGSLYYLRCRLAEGTPRPVDVWNGTVWWRTDICEFKDSSFVGLTYWSTRTVQFASK